MLYIIQGRFILVNIQKYLTQIYILETEWNNFPVGGVDVPTSNDFP